MRRENLLFLLVMLLSVVGASCGTQASDAPTPTPTSTPTQTPSPTPTPTPIPEPVEITVYFTDNERFADGTPPFEVEVSRRVDVSSDTPEAVMRAFFQGPTAEERDEGLELISNGFTGFSSLTIEDGIARIHLTGECKSVGGVYTVAQPIMKNLLQFPEVDYVKIYDSRGNTELPDGRSNSIPACLEP
jgi:hypothetical protein